MDLKRLEVFCRTVELKSFTKAAKHLNLSQPTVSEHIRHLEQVVGEKLLDRFGREVVATPAGRILYGHALKMLRLKSEALAEIEAFGGRLSGTLGLWAPAPSLALTCYRARLLRSKKSIPASTSICASAARTALLRMSLPVTSKSASSAPSSATAG
jgi:DNA-binding transcriptional LysR family regulator